jgi:hypothetical protein
MMFSCVECSMARMTLEMRLVERVSIINSLFKSVALVIVCLPMSVELVLFLRRNRLRFSHEAGQVFQPS